MRCLTTVGTNWKRVQIVFAVFGFVGCSNIRQSSAVAQSMDTYIVIKHVTDGDRYVILHGDVEIQARCQYSTYSIKGNDKMNGGFCLESLPVGKQLKMIRGAGDWLYCNWDVRDTQWHMGLIVEKEEVKGHKEN
jgi:hypothetical protein